MASKFTSSHADNYYLFNFVKNLHPLKVSIILITLLTLTLSASVAAQEAKRINVNNADNFDKNEIEHPGVIIAIGNVQATHEGVKLYCNQAYHYPKRNLIRAYGNVRLNQGDTLKLTSEYLEYYGDTKTAIAYQNVHLSDPKMSLTTDTLYFDRVRQQAYYNTYGTVRDSINVLTSKRGTYFANELKYQFLTNVKLVNPDYVIDSQHLDFYTQSGHVYMYGPTTITSDANLIYCERGFYDTKGNTSYFVKNSYIQYKNRLIEGDSLFYDRSREFASATNHIKVTDTLNKSVIKGHYAEVYKLKDSVFITKKAVAITYENNKPLDSSYIHADTLMVTGKEGERITRGFRNVRFYKSDLSGKSDSIHSNQKNGLTQLIRKPIIWSGMNQMTGDTIHLISNLETEKLDSLKVFNNAFMIEHDSIDNYNQVKGLHMYGLFRDNSLYFSELIKNTEYVYFSRSEQGELIGIDKGFCSKISMYLSNNQIDEITFFTNVDGTVYREEDLPKNVRKLRGFNWRGEEMIKTKDDIFIGDPPLALPKIRGIDVPLIEEDPIIELKRIKKEADEKDTGDGLKPVVPIKQKPENN